MNWNDKFQEIFDRCLTTYKGGNTDYTSYFTAQDLMFLSSIGCKPRELFDFVEDLGDSGVPSRGTALLVASARRDYFIAIQKEQHSFIEKTGNDMPSKTEALAGIAYLPRIIEKAKAKLRGELHPDLMFGCGGDRGFLKRNGDIPMADFLRNVWSAGEDEQQIVDYVLAQNTQVDAAKDGC